MVGSNLFDWLSYMKEDKSSEKDGDEEGEELINFPWNV